MTPPWKYFENLSEIVYVSDPETHELIYLNEYGRKAFSTDESQYRGQKCYEVLQGFACTCPFCTTGRLKQGQFYEWLYHNPVLDQLFTIKDTLIEFEDKLYRMEFALRTEQEYLAKHHYNVHIPYESVFNEAMLIALSTQDLHQALAYLGQNIQCSAMYLYENLGDFRAVITCFWSRDNLPAPPTDLLEIPFTASTQQWYRLFAKNQPVLLEDVEAKRRRNPELYARFRAEEVQRLILLPLLDGGRVTGIWRIDDPPAEKMQEIGSAFQEMARYIVTVLRQRERMRDLEEIGYHDQMTGALNRYALSSHLEESELHEDTGLIFCDVVGLKRINDRLGHLNGDRMIMQVYYTLGSVFAYDQIYRIGGDEFLVLCVGMSEAAFQDQVEQLRKTCEQDNCPLSVGSVWAAAGTDSLVHLLKLADEAMYRDKRSFYHSAGQSAEERETIPARGASAVEEFLKQYRFDAETFFRSLELPNIPFYLFFGDLKQNLFYVSDNLREYLRFNENLVYDFLHQLELCIYRPDRPRYSEEMRLMFAEKRERSSVRCRIGDRNGKFSWLHCSCLVQWNDARTEALFCAGTLLSLQNESDVDPVTGLLTISPAAERLEQLQQRKEDIILYCVIFRDFADINRTFGRSVGNAALQEIGVQLEQELGGSNRLYRLDGVKFLAVSPRSVTPQQFVERLQRTVKGIYSRYDIHIMYPCAVGVLYTRDFDEPVQRLIDNVIITAQTAKAFPALSYMEYEPEMSTTCRDHTDLSMMLNYSVNHGFQGFHAVIQPQVLAKDGEMFGGEVLLRWRDQGKEVSPVRFVPVLEQTGLIVPVGRWILERAVEICARVMRTRPDFLVSVNVSYLQIMDRDFFDFIQQTLKKYQVPPRNLLLELTETHFDEMPDHLKRFIQQCHEIGIFFALDDFGSAYSGLQLLVQYPADLIKLDRKLTREIASSTEKKNFIMSVVYACHRFGKKVCVEGVETEEELQTVRETDSDFIQGFYFYRPMEPEQLFRLIEQPERREGED